MVPAAAASVVPSQLRAKPEPRAFRVTDMYKRRRILQLLCRLLSRRRSADSSSWSSSIRPQGAYYGGVTAAPVTRATLEAALAARSTPLDKRAVAVAAPPPLAIAESYVSTVAHQPESGPFVFAMESGPVRRQVATLDENQALVPDVAVFRCGCGSRAAWQWFPRACEWHGPVGTVEPRPAARCPKVR